MDTNVNYTLVGAFIIVLIASIIFGIIWLSSGFSIVHYKTYKIYMQESVSGLNIDSPVEYNGVNVGSVTTIKLNTKDPHLVELLLNIEENTPISQATIATLKSKGLTGVTYVGLADKGNDLRPLKKLPGEDYPIIKAGPSLFNRLDTALSQLSINMRKVTDSIQNLLDPQNQASIKEILINMQEVTANLASNNKRFSDILLNTSKATAQFGPLIQSTTSTARFLETQTMPLTYRLLNNLDNASRSLFELTSEIKQNPSVLIRGNAPKLGPGESR